jgi:hypothetical protein
MNEWSETQRGMITARDGSARSVVVSEIAAFRRRWGRGVVVVVVVVDVVVRDVGSLVTTQEGRKKKKEDHETD